MLINSIIYSLVNIRIEIWIKHSKRNYYWVSDFKVYCLSLSLDSKYSSLYPCLVILLSSVCLSIMVYQVGENFSFHCANKHTSLF